MPLRRDRWEKLKEAFHGALERSGSDREAYLAQACGDDDELRARLEDMLAAERDSKTIDPMVRGSDIATVERCFSPGSMKHADARRQRNNPSERALFRGRGWDEVLVIPYYDLPWRHCACVLVLDQA